MMCANWDLCDTCCSAGVHNKHQMLKIEHLADAVSIQNDVVCSPLLILVILSLKAYYHDSHSTMTQTWFSWASECTLRAVLLCRSQVNLQMAKLFLGGRATEVLAMKKPSMSLELF